MALIKAAKILYRANGHPRNDAVTIIESTPVCGVAIKNPVDAPFDAPNFLREIAVGTTLHEHKGNGIPIITALKTLPNVELLSLCLTKLGETYTCKSPAIKRPIRSGNDSSKRTCQTLYTKSVKN